MVVPGKSTNHELALFAEGKLDEAIQITPDFLPYDNRTAAYVKKGRYQHAIEDFSKAIERQAAMKRKQLAHWEIAKQ
ncbi:MAG: tetratricopeptide repeat protein [Deltaproteobacteria bacterium]|nr:tetratricopeptide repeat protein [Deltaproteobacteria bacterium]